MISLERTRAPRNTSRNVNGARTSCAVFLAGLAAIMLGWLPVTATAQTRILSGEHDKFSRLALVFQQETDWSVQITTDGLRVTFDPDPGPIDLSGVFDLIPRTRIQNVSQDNDTGDLVIGSTCNCHVDAFEAGPRVLALDIKDGARPNLNYSAPNIGRPALPIGLTFRSTSSAGPVGNTSAFGREILRFSPSTSSLLLNGQKISVSRDPEISRSRSANPIDGNYTVEQGEGDQFEDGSGSFDEGVAAATLRAQLIEDVRRAAEAGLVDLVDDPAQGPPKSTMSNESLPRSASTPMDAAARATTSEGAVSSEAPGRNISLRTALEVPDGKEEAPGLAVCPSTTRFDFLSSRSAPKILASLPALRTALVDEAGRVDPEGARRLAEAYLALGFGVEARALTEEWEQALQEDAAIYRSLARILEESGDDAPEIWSQLQRCPSPVALWAFLGHEPTAGAPPVDSASIQRAFFALPTHLRLQIGSALSARLRRAGLTAAAASIESNVAVLNAATAPPASDDDTASADRSDAVSDAPAIVEGAAFRHVDALLESAGERMKASRLPAAADLDLAEAYAREYAGTERGDRLEDLVALRRIADGDLADAAALLAGAGDSSTDDTGSSWRDAFRQTAGATVAAKSDADLLAVALHSRNADLLAVLSTDQTVSVAERLTTLGFPDAALSALARIETPRGSPASRARARATLASGDAAQALAMLAGQTNAEAARIRAEALSALGRHALAAEAYDIAGDNAAAAREAWLSGVPEAISRFGTERQRKLAMHMLAPARQQDTELASADERSAVPLPASGPEAATAGVGQGVPSLSEARDLAERSLAVRESLRELLAGDAGGT